MTGRTERRLAIAAALILGAVVVLANARLLSVAVRSQPECREAAGLPPARPAC
ncbi:MAG: hypothetical protein R3D46_16530 [Defluviimonas denitrificans]